MPGILVVDDNPTMRFLLRVLIESKTNFSICGEAGHGMEAVQRAQELNPDLIMLDLSMPVMNGAEAAVILKKRMPKVKIILFTLHADNVGKALGAAVGIDLTLSKADGLMNLENHLKALLGPVPSTSGPENTNGKSAFRSEI